MFFSRFVFSFALMLSLVVTPVVASAQIDGELEESNSFLFEYVERVNDEFGEDSPVAHIKTLSDIENLPEAERASLLFLFSGPSVGAGADFESPANCFDYYTFGSVDAQIYSSSAYLTSGTEATFSVNLTNNNPYPVVDAGIYIKIFKQQPEGKSSIHMNPLVDQFQAVSGISMRAGETVSRDFSRMIPAGLPTGNYQAVAYVAVAERYNLLGLPFTDDIIGGTFDFTVTGESDEMVAWNREQVFVNNTQYYFAAYTPKVSPVDLINISAPLHNPTASPVDAEVTWSVYRWDQQHAEYLLSTETKIVSIGAGDTVHVPYTITDTDYAVYVLVGEAVVSGTKSVINVRMTREGIPTIRINYPGVTNFPLVAGEENTLFSCMHIAGTPNIVDGGSLILTLADMNGKEIFQHTYEGPITGAMMATAETFVPQATYQDFSLTASLYQDDVLVDEAYLIYDCETLTGGECPILAADKPSIFTPENVKSVLIMTLAALVIILFIIHYMRRRPEHIVVGSVILLAFFGGGLGDIEKAEAMSVQSIDSYTGSLVYRSTAQSWSTWYIRGLTNPIATVNYQAIVRNLDTGMIINNNATIPLGTNIEFAPNLGTIAWTGTGHSMDTPAGEWKAEAAYAGSYYTINPPFLGIRYIGTCSPQFYVGQDNYLIWSFAVFIPFSVNPSVMTVDVSGSTAGLSSLGGNKYRVDSPGNIKGIFNFSATYGKYYYEYSGWTGNDTCFMAYGIFPMAEHQGLVVDLPSPPPPYLATFPAKSITYNLTAVGAPPSSNNPPTEPVITGPVTAVEGDANTFVINSTDPDNDNIHYEIDWDMDGLMDQRIPNSGTVASGVSQDVNRTWNTANSYTFQARAVDINNAPSGWVSHTINITSPLSATALLELSVNGGAWSASDQTVGVSDAVDIRWTSANATACVGTAYNTGGNINGNVSLATPAAGTGQIYQVNCTGTGASGVDTITLNVLAVPLPTVSLSSNVNGGVFTTADKTINNSDQVQYQWSAVGAVACTGIGIPSLSGISGTIDIGEPSPGFTTSYGVRCFNSTGGWTDETLSVATRQPVTVTLSAEVDGSSIPILPEVVIVTGEEVTLSWTSSNADTCVGTNFNTGGALNENDVATNEPSSGISQTYTVTCSDSYGQSASESVIVRTISPSNLLPLVGNITPSAGFNSITGNYSSITIAYSTRNDGATDAGAFVNQITMDIDNNGSVDNTVSQSLSGLAAGAETPSQSVLLANDVPFGIHRAVIMVDSGSDVSESNEADNQVIRITSIPVPDPGLSITVDEVVANRGIATVNWDTGSTFPMNCSVFGAGTTPVHFDPGVAGATGTAQTGAVTSKSEVTIRCIEPSTGTIFTASDLVETVGGV